MAPHPLTFDRPGKAVAILDPAIRSQALRAPMRIDKDVPMTTRDGVTLRADVYRPDGPGRFPVLLSRLPYDKNQRRRPGDIDAFVEHGYVVIMQDTRGRFASDGDEYYPLIWEAQDGYDAVEWAAQLPYADGQVGTMGQSYLGATQYLLAPTRPPHLQGGVPGLGAGRLPPVLGLSHGRRLRARAGRSPTRSSWRATRSRARGSPQTLLPELERVLAPAPTPWAPPLSPEAYRRLPLTAWAELLEPVAALPRRLSAASGGRGRSWWPINVERQHGQIDRAHVPRDVLVRHLPARAVSPTSAACAATP